ncbi:MAG: hypothetical protein ACI81P_003346 [Neolewinella sp.]|jgi:hypothetical protein
MLFFSIQLAVGYSQNYNCPSVSILNDANFQQTSIRFKQDNGKEFTVDLHSNNPYNELSIPFSEKDGAYNMSVYDLSDYPDSIKKRVLFNVFPYQRPNTAITGINSMVSVQLNKECIVHVNYSVFGFADDEGVLAMSSTSIIYDSQGNLIGIVNGQEWGNSYCEISESTDFMICLSGYSFTREQKGGGSIRVIEIKNNKVLHEINFNTNEYLSGAIGRVLDSDIYICTIEKRSVQRVPTKDETTLIFMPSERTIRKYRYTDYCSTLGFWPTGVVSYLDEKRGNKITVKWESLPIVGRF